MKTLRKLDDGLYNKIFFAPVLPINMVPFYDAIIRHIEEVILNPENPVKTKLKLSLELEGGLNP